MTRTLYDGLALATLLLAVGCIPQGNNDGSGGSGGSGGEAGDAGPGGDDAGQPICRDGAPTLDLLFVVDNSGSMCEEQDELGARFDVLDARLTALGVDWRAAVVSTDMVRDNRDRGRFLADPALPVPSLNCVDAQGNPSVPDTADCAALIEAGDLDPILVAGAHDAAGRALRFRCLANLGTQGDGFEKGLEAMRVGLSCDGPNAEAFGACCVDGRYDQGCGATPEFLRPDAMLAVVFVSDENDCAAPDDNPARSRRAICKYGPIDTDGDGVPDGFADPELCPGDQAACYAAECDDLTPAQCQTQRCEIPRTENNSCEWYRDTLTPVEDYVDFLRSRKRDPGQVIVAAFAAPQMYTEGGFPVHFDAGRRAPECMAVDEDFDSRAVIDDACCPGGRCVGQVEIVCDTDSAGGRFAGDRYHAVARAFGGVGCERLGEAGCVSLCDDRPMQPLYEALADRIADAIPPSCDAVP